MFKQIKAVFFKEMKSIMRDRRGFILSLIIPLLLIPLMLIVMDFAMTKNSGSSFTVARIAINRKDNSFYDFCAAQNESLIIVDITDKDKAFATGQIHAYADVGENIDREILEHEPISLKIDYNEKSLNAMMAMPVIAYYENTYRYCAEEQDDLNFTNIDEIRTIFSTKLPPYKVEDQGTHMQDFDFMGICFNMLIPMMLLLYCYYGSIGTANEVTVGEKERGTLESLLSTSAHRTAIILGKLFATTTMGILSSICTIIGLCSSLFFTSKTNFNLSWTEIAVLFALVLFSSMFFSAVNITIGLFSRSSKEAQIYFTPITFILVLPAYFTYTLDASQIQLPYMSIPVFNVVCMIKEVFSHAVVPMHFAVVLSWLIIYTSVVFTVAFKMFKKESVIFRT